jgi:hypothetical protein
LAPNVVKDNEMEVDSMQPPQQPVIRGKDGQAVEPAVGTAAEPPSDEVVARLEVALSQAKARQMVISSERKAISLAAHMGSADDRARLNQLNQEGAILLGEIESIEAAITDVQTRIANANAAAALEAEHKKREATVRLADELRGHAAKIDELWRHRLRNTSSSRGNSTRLPNRALVGRPGIRSNRRVGAR